AARIDPSGRRPPGAAAGSVSRRARPVGQLPEGWNRSARLHHHIRPSAAGCGAGGDDAGGIRPGRSTVPGRGRAMKRTDRREGMALLTVLLLVAVMSVIAVAVLDDVRFSVRRATNAETQTQAQWYADGAEALARKQV